MSTISTSTSEGLVYPISSIPFLLLTDTPASYTGQAGKIVKVNPAETGLEYGSATAATTFIGLADVPGTYVGSALKFARVNAAETALEFATAGAGSVTGSALTSGNVITGAGSSTIQDSGVPIANVTRTTAVLTTGNVLTGAGGVNMVDGGVALTDLALSAEVPTDLSQLDIGDATIPRLKLNYGEVDLATVTSAGTATLVPSTIYYGTVSANLTIAFSPAITASSPPTILYLNFTGQPWTLTYPSAIRNDANGATTSVAVASNKYVIITFVKTGAGNLRMFDNITDVTSATVSDTAYDATTWNGVATTAPSQNAVRDQVETMLATVAALPTAASSTTFTNKRVTKRLGTTASSATPSINSDSVDVYTITAQAAAITSLTITGTPTEGQSLLLQIKDDGTNRALAFGTGSCAFSSDLAAPTTTTTGKWQEYSFLYRVALTKWVMTGKLENIA